MPAATGTSIIEKIRIFTDKRVLGIFLLGISQGLPWVMIGSMLTLWLKDSGISRTHIGFAALIYTVYAVNFLWSPLVEMLKPKFGFKLGQRQSWVFMCQVIIALCCLAMTQVSPTINALPPVLIALAIATFSATQDIAIDAYRVDSFEANETQKIAAGAGVITAGWWTGYAGIGALPLFLSDRNWAWSELYVLLAGLTFFLAMITTRLPDPIVSHTEKRDENFLAALNTIARSEQRMKTEILYYTCSLVGLIVLILLQAIELLPLPFSALWIFILVAIALVVRIIMVLNQVEGAANNNISGASESRLDHTLAWLITAMVSPLRDFFSRNGLKLAIALLAFVLLFKLGEAFLGRMSIVFYKEIGFSNSQIATYSKLITWWLTVFFSLLGALVNARFGLVRGLLVSGIAMASTNLLFSLIAVVGPDERLYAIAIILDGFAQAWSTVAFVAFISLLCNYAFSATQYALLASLSNLGRTSLSSMSGWIVDKLDGNWALFFALTTLMVIPSLIILWNLRHYVNSLLDRNRDSN